MTIYLYNCQLELLFASTPWFLLCTDCCLAYIRAIVCTSQWWHPRQVGRHRLISEPRLGWVLSSITVWTSPQIYVTLIWIWVSSAFQLQVHCCPNLIHPCDLSIVPSTWFLLIILARFDSINSSEWYQVIPASRYSLSPFRYIFNSFSLTSILELSRVAYSSFLDFNHFSCAF